MFKLMKSVLLALAAMVSFTAALSLNASAAEFGSADEAVAMVHQAVAYLHDNGRDQLIVEANKSKGRFVDRDLYIVIHDMQGKALANPVLPRMVGADISGVKDVDGKAFIHDRLVMLKTADKGWIDFKWPNSLTQKIEHRSVYFERVGDLVFACGILKK